MSFFHLKILQILMFKLTTINYFIQIYQKLWNNYNLQMMKTHIVRRSTILNMIVLMNGVINQEIYTLKVIKNA